MRLMLSHWVFRLMSRRLIRLCWLVPAAAVLAYALALLAPVDPVEAYVGARTSLIGPEQRALIAQQLGLDAPAHERFLRWAAQMLQGNWGYSTIYQAPVMEVLASRFQATLVLMMTAFVLSGVIGFTLGLVAGGWPNSLADQIIRGIAVVLAASPAFWVAMVLIAVFAVSLNWLPACCAAPPGAIGTEITLLDRMRHLILPATALSIVGIAPLILHSRQRQIETMESPASRLLLVHGASRRQVVFGAGARHAAGPALALHMAGMGELFGGSILAEAVFGWPGLGQATMQSALQQDVPLLLGIAILTVVFVFTGNLLADLTRYALDPRLRQNEVAV